MSSATDTVYNTGYNSGYNAGYAVGPSQYNKSFSIPISLSAETTNDTVTNLSAEGTLYFNPYTGAKSGTFTLAGHGKYWDASNGKWVHTNASKRVNI